MKKGDIYSELRELFKLLKVLEKNQAAARDAVKIALRERNISEIQRLSNIIRDNRRKPQGLRELNAKIRELDQIYWGLVFHEQYK